MSSIKDAAIQCYDTLLNQNYVILKTEWKRDDILGLLSYDVLRLTALLYVLSDESERERIVRKANDMLGQKD